MIAFRWLDRDILLGESIKFHNVGQVLEFAQASPLGYGKLDVRFKDMVEVVPVYHFNVT